MYTIKRLDSNLKNSRPVFLNHVLKQGVIVENRAGNELVILCIFLIGGICLDRKEDRISVRRSCRYRNRRSCLEGRQSRIRGNVMELTPLQERCFKERGESFKGEITQESGEIRLSLISDNGWSDFDPFSSRYLQTNSRSTREDITAEI